MQEFHIFPINLLFVRKKISRMKFVKHASHVGYEEGIKNFIRRKGLFYINGYRWEYNIKMILNIL